MTRLGTITIAAGMLLVAGMAAGAEHAAAGSVLVVVRVYDATGVTDTDRGIALAQAAAILTAANIHTTWPDCRIPSARTDTRSPRQETATCDTPLRPGELAVRFLRGIAPRTLAGPVPLGYSLIDMRLRAGALATIYLDRVEWLADAAGVDARMLIGRAIAHEIGHLLIGTNAHSQTGLMRANWSREALQESGTADWLFTSRQRQEMHRTIERSTPVAQIAENVVWGNGK